MDTPNAQNAISPAELAKLLETESGSQIINTKVVTLKTTPAKRSVAQEYQRVPKFFTQIFLHSYRRIRNDEARAVYETKAEDYRFQLTRQLMNTSEEISKLTTKWVKLLSEQYGSEFEINDNYSNPTVVEINVKTPEEGDFWQIVEQMDFLLIVMDNLWQLKDLSLVDKQNVTTKIVAQITRIGQTAHNLSIALRKLRDTISEYEGESSSEEEHDTTQESLSEEEAI